MKILRIKNWDLWFESAKSREYNHRSQFYCPNKHGLGYQRILAHPNGEAIFGCWQAVCQVLSRQEKPRHGYLTDTGKASGIQYTPDDLSLLTRYSAKTCSEMLELCSSQSVGWIEFESVKDTARISDGTTKEPQSHYPLPLPSPLPDKDKPASKSPDTWMTEFGTIWKARFGGELPFKKFARPLAKVVRDYGNEKALAGFTRYCRETPAEYANAESFAQKAGVWINGNNGGSHGGQADQRRAEKRDREYVEPKKPLPIIKL